MTSLRILEEQDLIRRAALHDNAIQWKFAHLYLSPKLLGPIRCNLIQYFRRRHRVGHLSMSQIGRNNRRIGQSSSTEGWAEALLSFATLLLVPASCSPRPNDPCATSKDPKKKRKPTDLARNLLLYAWTFEVVLREKPFGYALGWR